MEVNNINCLPLNKGSAVDNINDLSSAIQNDKADKAVGDSTLDVEVILVGLMSS